MFLQTYKIIALKKKIPWNTSILCWNYFFCYCWTDCSCCLILFFFPTRHTRQPGYCSTRRYRFQLRPTRICGFFDRWITLLQDASWRCCTFIIHLIRRDFMLRQLLLLKVACHQVAVAWVVCKLLATCSTSFPVEDCKRDPECWDTSDFKETRSAWHVWCYFWPN